MKEVKDGKVPDRAFYYVLDWCDHNRHEFILTQYNKLRVRDLTVKQFFKVMDYNATETPRSRQKDGGRDRSETGQRGRGQSDHSAKVDIGRDSRCGGDRHS